MGPSSVGMESGGPLWLRKCGQKDHLGRVCPLNASARVLGTSLLRGAAMGARCGQPLLGNTAGLETKGAWAAPTCMHTCLCVCMCARVRVCVAGFSFNATRTHYVSDNDKKGIVSAFRTLST